MVSGLGVKVCMSMVTLVKPGSCKWDGRGTSFFSMGRVQRKSVAVLLDLDLPGRHEEGAANFVGLVRAVVDADAQGAGDAITFHGCLQYRGQEGPIGPRQRRRGRQVELVVCIDLGHPRLCLLADDLNLDALEDSARVLRKKRRYPRKGLTPGRSAGT